LDEVYVDAAEERLPQKPLLSKADRELLAKGLKFYEQFAHQNEGVVEARRHTAKAYLRVGSIRRMLGQHKEAERALRASEENLRIQEVRESPTERRFVEPGHSFE